MKNIIVIVFTLILLFPAFSHSTGVFNRCMQWIKSLSPNSVRSLSAPKASEKELSTQEILETELSAQEIQQLSSRQVNEVLDMDLVNHKGELKSEIKHIVENLNTAQIQDLADHRRAPILYTELRHVWSAEQQAEFIEGALISAAVSPPPSNMSAHMLTSIILNRASSLVLNIVFNSKARVSSLTERQMHQLLRNINLFDLNEPIKQWITEKQIEMARKDPNKVSEILFFEYVTPKHIRNFSGKYREYLRRMVFQLSINKESIKNRYKTLNTEEKTWLPAELINVLSAEQIKDAVKHIKYTHVIEGLSFKAVRIAFNTLSPTQKKDLTMEQIQSLSKEQKQRIAPDLSDYQLYQLSSSTDLDIMLDFFSFEQVGVLLNMELLPKPQRQQLINRLNNISNQQMHSLSIRGHMLLTKHLPPTLQERASNIVSKKLDTDSYTEIEKDAIYKDAIYLAKHESYVNWLSGLKNKNEAQAAQSLSEVQLISWYEFFSVEAKRNLSTSQIMDLLPDQLADWVQYLTKEDISFLESQSLDDPIAIETNLRLLEFLLPYLSLKQRGWISQNTLDMLQPDNL